MAFSHKYFWHITLGSAFFAGIFFFLMYHQWLIIHFNSGRSYQEERATLVEKKTTRLHYLKNNTWHYEDVEVLWSSDTAQNILYVTNRWLSLLDEENIHSKKIIVQQVSMAPSGTQAYISLDRYPFERQSSAYAKYMFIEGLLKTLRHSNITISEIYFLVHHKPIEDYHLSFSHPWPLESFSLEEKTFA